MDLGGLGALDALWLKAYGAGERFVGRRRRREFLWTLSEEGAEMLDRVARSLGLNRVARLHGPIHIGAREEDRRPTAPEAKGELTLVVGTGDDYNTPIFHLETLNLVIDPAVGGGPATPSARLPGGATPRLEFDPKSQEIGGTFEIDVHVPEIPGYDEEELDPEDDTPGSVAVRSEAELRGRFLGRLRPVEYGLVNLECKLSVRIPDEYVAKFELPELFEWTVIIVMQWFFFLPRKQLRLQPVFIAADGATPSTGADFYPLLARANEIWAKCCVQFVAECPPMYVDEQDYRISTTAEAAAFKNEVSVADAIEVFVVERLDPEDAWGGGATFSSGTAAAKIVTGDNQLPLNQNHLAHELGHVLGLGHPANPGALIAGCVGSVMEPSGFFADNPEFQCDANCNNAANPLLCTVPFQSCLVVNRPDDELF